MSSPLWLSKALDWVVLVGSTIIALLFLVIGLYLFMEWTTPLDLTPSQVAGLLLMVFALAWLNMPIWRSSRDGSDG